MDPETTFGRYRVTATLGEGEMGTVYLAEDPSIERKVAIKTLRRPPAGQQPTDDLARARFDREIRVTGTFTHPNIITVYDVGLETEEAFIAMAYVDGGDLRSMMASAGRPLPFQQIVELLSQIASGLDYAHDKGVIHRDIKPTNILLTADGTPMLSDFGVARMADSELTRQGEACGSPAYMSPEQAAAQEVTGASDQFSLAIVTYELLTGEVPFAGQSIATVMYRILQTDPVPPECINPLVPVAAGQVVMRGLSRLPTDRYPSCTAFADALAEALAVATAAPGYARKAGSDPAGSLGNSANASADPANASGAHTKNALAASTAAQLAATVVTSAALPGQRPVGGIAQTPRRLWDALTSGLASVRRRLPAWEGIDHAPGWAAAAWRFTVANRQPLLLGAALVLPLAASMWLATRSTGGGAAGETESSGPATEAAIATLPLDVFRGPTAPSEPNDAATDEGIPLLLMRPPASDGEPDQADTETVESAGPSAAAVAPQAADEERSPVAAEAESTAAATGPTPATADPAAATTEPAPETNEITEANREAQPTRQETPGVVATDAGAAAVDTDAPDARWTMVAAGTMPDKFVERAAHATTVIEEISGAADHLIPDSLLDRASCVAVIPNVRKVGFIIGTRYGRGVVSCRTDGGWSRPSFVSLSGGGFKIGAQSTDFVLVFVDQAAADRLLGDEFTLGADAAVAAGPVGSTPEAAAEETPQAEIYAYSLSGGTFAGVALDGADLGTDEDANKDVYGSGIGPQELLVNDTGELPEELEAFVRVLAIMAAGGS